MVWLGDASEDAMWRALRVSYGIEVDTAGRMALRTSSSGMAASWKVKSTAGDAFEVCQYGNARDVLRARIALDASEHCRSHGLPLPEAVPDLNGFLVCPTADGGGYTVTRAVHGAVATGPMTPEHAREAGALLGRLHRALSGYPLPDNQAQDDQAVFVAASLDQALLAEEEGLQRASATVWGQERRRLDALSAGRVENLRTHLAPARQRLGTDLTLHVVHGAVTAEHLHYRGDTAIALTGFRAPVGYPALELARLAVDPLTAATRKDWIDIALTVVDAYAAHHPYLLPSDIQAVPDIAFLSLLTQIPHRPHAQVEAWETSDSAVDRLLGHLDELRAALAQVPSAKRSSR